MSKSFCPMLMTSLEIDTPGFFRPCCVFDGYIKDETGQPFNALNSTITDVFESTHYNGLREKMHNDEQIEGCHICYSDEKNNRVSRRQREMERFKYDDIEQPNLILLDIKLGNTCNYACIICNTYSSSRLYEEEHRLGLIEKFPRELLDQFKWYRNDAIWEDLLSQHSSTLKWLDIMGGEPLLALKNLNFLDEIVDKNLHEQININFVSNGSIVSEKLNNMLEKFHHVEMTLSADGIGDVYNYARFPGNWDNFKNNLTVYKNLNIDVTISYSVSIYSLFGIFDALDFYSDVNVPVWFNYVHNIDRGIKAFPQKYKDEFIKQYELRKTDKWDTVLKNSSFESLINFMNSEDNSSYWGEFLERTDKFDKNRNLSIETILPNYL